MLALTVEGPSADNINASSRYISKSRYNIFFSVECRQPICIGSNETKFTLGDQSGLISCELHLPAVESELTACRIDKFVI